MFDAAKLGEEYHTVEVYLSGDSKMLSASIDAVRFAEESILIEREEGLEMILANSVERVKLLE